MYKKNIQKEAVDNSFNRIKKDDWEIIATEQYEENKNLLTQVSQLKDELEKNGYLVIYKRSSEMTGGDIYYQKYLKYKNKYFIHINGKLWKKASIVSTTWCIEKTNILMLDGLLNNQSNLKYLWNLFCASFKWC